MDSLGGAGADKTGALVANDIVVVLSVVFGMVIILAIGIALGVRSRKRRRNHHHPHRRGSASQSTTVAAPKSEESSDDNGEPSSSGRRRRTRRRRRDHRPRNPTLAEAGGLPPTRPEDVPPSAGSPSGEPPV